MTNFEKIKDFILSAESLLRSPESTINSSVYTEREEFIEKLETYKAAMADALQYVQNTINIARDIHLKESNIMRKLLKKETIDSGHLPLLDEVKNYEKTNKANRDTTEVNINTSQTINKNIQKIPITTIHVQNSHNQSPKVIQLTEKIKITDSLFLEAKCVPSFDKVQQDGCLYYLAKYNHFAIIIAGVMFHGNIGRIFGPKHNKEPEKIKDCRFGITCVRNGDCMYYHDPKKFPLSKDVRNHISLSWLYMQPSVRNNPYSRKFGDIDYLDTDLLSVNLSDLSKFDDQIMHDLLCSLVAHKIVK